jgi:putative hemolysin
MWLELVLIIALIIVNAALAGSEMALVSLREGQLVRLEQRSEAGRLVARLARDPNRFLSAIQVGLTLAGFLASAVAAVSLAKPLVDPLGFLGKAAEPVAILLVTLVLTFFTLVLGELAPKRIAMQRAERWALIAARPLSALATATRPLLWLLGRSTDLAVRLMGGDPNAQREEVTPEELREMIDAQPEISPEQRAIIAGAFEVKERRLRTVLVSRGDVLAFPADTPAPAARAEMIAEGHSRAPVYRDSIDDIVGLVHLRNLVDVDGPVSAYARDAIVFPDSVGVLDALRRLQAERAQLALVADEHGTVSGIVTIEDLLEEIVGEIYDEFDRDLQPISPQDDGSVVLPGSFPIHDLEDIGVEVPEGDYATVAGLLLWHLGHIPSAGEEVGLPGYRAVVLAMDGLSIDRLRLLPDGGPPAKVPEAMRRHPEVPAELVGPEAERTGRSPRQLGSPT